MNGSEITSINNQYHKDSNNAWIHTSYVVTYKTALSVLITLIPRKHWTDCAADFYAQTEYKDSDLPYFHATTTYSPVQKMHYK